MPILFYCHSCTNVFSLDKELRSCTFCSSDIIEEIQEEESISVYYNEISESDGEKTPIMESSGINKESQDTFVSEPPKPNVSSVNESKPKNYSGINKENQDTFVSEPQKPNVSSVNESKPKNYSGINKENQHTFVSEPPKLKVSSVNESKPNNYSDQPSVSLPITFELNNNPIIYNSIPNRQLKDDSIDISHISQDNTGLSSSPNKSPPTNSLFQIKTSFSEIFRVKSKSDKLMNKVSLQSINFSIRDDCSICLKYYQSKDFVRITQCGHKYHETCLKSWLKVKKECPICRSQFKL